MPAAGAALPSLRGTAAGGAPMMPFMPMGGAAGGEESQGQERTSWLTEEHDVWNTGHEVIPPVIT
ncbi:hypothetical protein [Planomonospora algeriensis]